MKDRHGYVVGTDRADFLFAWRLKGAPDSPQWRRGLAEMKAVFAADVACRRPAYTAAMRLVDRGGSTLGCRGIAGNCSLSAANGESG
ncbi:hypothetical protein ACPXB5_08370 [Micromonospora arida]|uniref:hypothetical protein n=1 Tax=Micromonospora arida TaxID=2203715 RepID=UPI003CEE0747